MATDETIFEVLDYLAATYGKEPSDQQIGIYLAALADLDDDELRQAATECVKSSQWFPRISELRAAALRIHEHNQHNPDPRRLYWQAMSLQAMRLRGEISESQLEREPAWKWYEHNRPPAVLILDEEWALTYDAFAEVEVYA